MATMPIFGAGNYQNILNSIKNGAISYPAWMYCRDRQMLGFVERDGSFVLMKGDNKNQVVYVDELPSVSEGDTEVLYVVGRICYKFDGTSFIALGKDHTEELESLSERIDVLEDTTEELQTANEETVNKLAKLDDTIDSITEQITVLEDKIEELSKKPECECEKDKYEVAYKPDNTLIDYREKEIRIMCPSNTQWAVQNVGSTGDINKYYIGLKAYAPNDNVVSFKEDLAEIIADDTMYSFENNDFAGIDVDGRKYSIIWLPVAVNENGVWSYYGANSSAEKFLGWYYSVEWYNADGVIISVDCIRINLTNETCHTIVEPYYMSSVKADVNALKEANAEVTEQLKTVTEQMTEIEERIVEVEKEVFTFIELD